MGSILLRFVCVSVIVTACLLYGCSFNHQLFVTPVRQVPTETKIPIPVALELSPEFCNYKYSWQMGVSDRHNFPLGRAFCRGAEMVSEAAFTEVIVTSKGTGYSSQNVAGILIPQVVSVDILGAPWKWHTQTALMMIKWTFIDNTGKLIWVKTCKGEEQSTGKHWLTMIQMSLDNLFQDSLKSIIESEEIRGFAASMTNSKRELNIQN